MYSKLLRILTYILLISIVVIAIFSRDFNMNILLSVVLILIFLLIFTFLFKTDGSKALKVALILIIFIALPLFILFYLNIFAVLGLWDSVLAFILAGLLGVISIITIVKLDDAEFKV